MQLLLRAPGDRRAPSTTGATFQSGAASTGDNTNYFRANLHLCAAAGVHTTVMGTLSFLTSTDAAALTPVDFTLTSTAANLVVADGEGISLLFTDVGGTNTTIALNSCVTLHLLRGEGAGQ